MTEFRIQNIEDRNENRKTIFRLLTSYFLLLTSNFWLLASGFLLLTSESYAQPGGYNHPELKWECIETEHFVVYYHNGLNRTPKLVAKVAEEIYRPITSLYKFIPDSKVHIIVKDTDDYSNGAAYYYDNKIEIWTKPSDFILRGTHNWIRNTLTHEFAHIVSMQRARKMSRSLPALYFQGIGYEKEKREDVLYGFPNVLISYPFSGTIVPMWFAEGMAQYGADKLGWEHWDSHRDMIIRMRVLNDDLLSLNEMGVFGKTSIGNESTYNQGYSLVKYIADKYGDESLEKLAKAMGSFFAVSFNHAVKKVFGITQKQLYVDWKNHLETYYRDKTESIAENEVKGKIIEDKGNGNFFPAWSPDGKSYAYISNKNSDYISLTSLYTGALNESKQEFLVPGVAYSVSWSRDNEKIVYSRYNKREHGSYFYDLFIYDLKKKKEVRLTKGMRAMYPAFSPDGTKISFASGSDGSYNLTVMDIDTKKLKFLTNFNDDTQICQSSWSPDGSKIAFCISKDASKDIALIDSDGKNIRYPVKGNEDSRNPVFSPDGKKIYFSSDLNGVFNIYSLDIETGDMKQLTNVLGGAFMPSVNEKGQLIYTIYTKDGYKIALIENPEPINMDKAHYITDYAETKPKVNYDDADVPNFEASEYQRIYSKTSIVPRVMMDYGKPKIGLAAISSEILDKYNLYATASVNPDFDYDLIALLDYRELKPTFFLELYSLSRHVTEGSDKIKLSLLEADVGASFKINDRQDFRAAFIYSRYSTKMKFVEPIRLTFRYNYFIGKNFSFSWNYNRARAKLDDEINPSTGRDIQFRYDIQFNKFLRDFNFERSFSFEEFDNYNYNSFFLKWNEYITLPFGITGNALTYSFQGGFVDRPVDSFFYLFGGGLLGMKGYSYYSLEGDKMLLNSLTYRAPVLKNIDFQFGQLYFDKIYGGVTYFYGNNWIGNRIDLKNFKKSIDFQIRIDAFSYYNYPTRFAFDAAYGFDRINYLGGLEGKEWKFYFQVLFEYL